MDIKIALQAAVNAYCITAKNGAKFWAPYLRNDDYTENPNVPRGLGKATAEEISAAANYVLSIEPEADGEQIRARLTDGSLPDQNFNYKGIDCSGFVFHVMDQVYQKVMAKSLAEDLSVPKDQVLNGAYNLEEWKIAYSLSEKEASSLPEDVPMKWVVEAFKRKAQNLCRVRGLVSDYSSVPVAPKDIQVGDLIHCQVAADPVPHICIVYDCNDDSAVLAHSSRGSRSSGVSLNTVARINAVPNTQELDNPHEFIAIRRLKSLA